MTELHLRAMQVIWQSSKISAYQRRKTNLAKVANLCPAGKVGSLPIRGNFATLANNQYLMMYRLFYRNFATCSTAVEPNRGGEEALPLGELARSA